MNQKEFAKIQSQVCNDIYILYSTLQKIAEIHAEGLYQCMDVIKSSPFKYGEEQLVMSVDDITINVEPTNIRHLSLTGKIDHILMHLYFEGVIDANVWKDKEKNPWLNISYKSILEVMTIDGEKFYKDFHIDYLQQSNTGFEDIHPQSHVHFSSRNDNVEALNIDVPRLAHYPVDIVLGLSISLQNYAPDLFAKLILDNQYVSLCLQSQKRILIPYYVMCNGIDGEGKSNKNMKIVCPYLL